MDPSPDGVVCEADESQCIHLVGDHKGRVQSQVPFAEDELEHPAGVCISLALNLRHEDSIERVSINVIFDELSNKAKFEKISSD